MFGFVGGIFGGGGWWRGVGEASESVIERRHLSREREAPARPAPAAR
jgi:hypothetical protein